MSFVLATEIPLLFSDAALIRDRSLVSKTLQKVLEKQITIKTQHTDFKKTKSICFIRVLRIRGETTKRRSY